MCGIAGWYRRGLEAVIESDVVAQCDAIEHRGPDDAGVFVDGNFGFGMRRLSILDIAGGHQPMSDGKLSLVFNGEIYNHRDLRPDLVAFGWKFSTNSDTETVLAAYACWGNDAWARLEGMFAAAIWNRAERSLTLVRDPLGIKPLYITEQRGGVAFASELKGLLTLPNHDFDVCDRAVHDFFSFGHVRRPRSIYRQVRSLEPGHFTIISAAGTSIDKAYWQPQAASPATLTEVQWVEQMRAMLSSTVERHMQSDVPVGAFLSGGDRFFGGARSHDKGRLAAGQGVYDRLPRRSDRRDCCGAGNRTASELRTPCASP